MTVTHLHRGMALLLILLMLTALSAVAVHAAQKADFALTDAQITKNRIFTVDLCAAGCSSISSFIAEITYDPDAVQYRSASAGDTAQYSVNSTESGKLTLVYLCEEGTHCIDKTKLVTLTFKATVEENTQMNLAVTEAIDSAAKDIAVGECKGSLLTAAAVDGNVSNNISGEKAKEHTSATFTDTTEDAGGLNSSKGITVIGGTPLSVQAVVSIVLAVLALLCTVGFIAYKLGAKRQREIDYPHPPIFKDSKSKENKSDKGKRKERKADEENT